VFEITPELLKSRSITLLMLDLDNTLAPYRGSEPTEKLHKWKESLIESGVKLVIVSNTKSKRAKNFSDKLGIPYIDHARKPFTVKTLEVIKNNGAEPSSSALAGDQIFTDIWCANNAGILSIIVRPLELKNIFFILRYGAESVFRLFTPKTF
jgi:HAD superfamily phosphatase (TIGR01668 family)